MPSPLASQHVHAASAHRILESSVLSARSVLLNSRESGFLERSCRSSPTQFEFHQLGMQSANRSLRTDAISNAGGHNERHTTPFTSQHCPEVPTKTHSPRARTPSGNRLPLTHKQGGGESPDHRPPVGTYWVAGTKWGSGKSCLYLSWLLLRRHSHHSPCHDFQTENDQQAD